MRTIITAAIGAALLSCAAVGPAVALTSKECSTKYQAANRPGR
jgi:hypothetical protein